MSASVSAGVGPGALSVDFALPRKLAFLMEPFSYKIAYGGRHSLKSHSFSGALLMQALSSEQRILCGREVQKSISQSVHQLLVDKIDQFGIGSYFDIQDQQISCRRTGSTFRFAGLSDITIDNTKSIEGVTRLWGEEAQRITRRSWQTVLPTLFRTVGAECWASFNPDLETDETYQRFVVKPPVGAKIVHMNWRDASAIGAFPPEQERLRQSDLLYFPDDYDNIWEGVPRSSVSGAIYGRELSDLVSDGRFRSVPYDPRLPVHRVWDLGWNDLMSVVMVQKPTPSSVVVVNYFEDKFLSYAEVLGALDKLRYRWGDDWLPHDASQHHPTSGTNARKLLRDLGCRVRDIPRTGDEPRIRAARMMFPRCYIDDSKHGVVPERPDRQVGGGYLVDRLRHFKRHVPKATDEPTSPVHDIASHAASAFGGLAEIVDRIRNSGDDPVVYLPGYQNYNTGTGMLG